MQGKDFAGAVEVSSRAVSAGAVPALARLACTVDAMVIHQNVVRPGRASDYHEDLFATRSGGNARSKYMEKIADARVGGMRGCVDVGMRGCRDAGV
jgi:hypothetical protein